ncbi:diaminopimelate decarboxylase [Methylolobus aquaticus]
MDHFNYRDGILHAEAVPLPEIAKRFGTPVYVYCRATLERHFHAFDRVFEGWPHLVCYAVKANSNLGVLDVLARLGSGFDIVSVGELERVLAAGGSPEKVVFSGVGKREDEMRRALDVGIRCFNVEVAEELDRLSRLAGEMGVVAPVSIRVNPDVDAGTHPYISTGLRENKFGLDIDAALVQYLRAARLPNLDIVGIDCHIGSQLTSVEPFLDALDRILRLADRLSDAGIRIRHLDLGGGLGIRYQDEIPPEPADYAAAVMDRLRSRDYEVLIEPGRAIAGNAGILLMRVEYLKSTQAKHFAIVDAAMNDLIRPALYQAWQEIVPVKQGGAGPERTYDIVGPVCETGDFLGKERSLGLEVGDLLAARSAGAYGFSMSSNYNSRPRAAEVMVDGAKVHLVRQREDVPQLFAGECRIE